MMAYGILVDNIRMIYKEQLTNDSVGLLLLISID